MEIAISTRIFTINGYINTGSDFGGGGSFRTPKTLKSLKYFNISKTPKTFQNNKTLKHPRTQKPPKLLKNPQNLKKPRTPKTFKTLKTSKPPKSPKKTLQTPKPPKTPKTYKTPLVSPITWYIINSQSLKIYTDRSVLWACFLSQL